MSTTPLYLDLGDASTAPKPKPVPVMPGPPPPRPGPFMPGPPPPKPGPFMPRPVSTGPWRADPVVKDQVMKTHCPQCGTKRQIIVGGAGLGPKIEAWICPNNPSHAVQTWPVRLNAPPAR